MMELQPELRYSTFLMNDLDEIFSVICKSVLKGFMKINHMIKRIVYEIWVKLNKVKYYIC